MYEDIGKLIGEGFDIWRRNLNLCVPFLLAIVFSLLAIAPLVAIVAVLFGSIQNLESITSPEELISRFGAMLPDLAAAFLVFILVVYLVNSYFTAGGIAMAEQAVTEGKTSTRVMWSAGKRHFQDMFVASILMGLIMLAGLIFLLPGFLSLPLSELNNIQTHPNAIGLLALGAIFLIIYLLVMSLVLATVPYALVVDVLGPIGAVKASINFFNYNKFDVFILWIIVVAISLGLQMAVSSAAAAGAEAVQGALSILVSVVNVVVIAPLANVWWTRLYMSRTGKRLYEEGVENGFDEPK
ncbi:MAG: hypothetical protein ABR985_03960 [Methanotrichaceae archaeon]